MEFFTDGTLDDAINAEGPVAVTFAASWCARAQHVAEALADLAAERQTRLTVGVIDVDAHPAAPVRFGVRGLPTTILFKDGCLASTRLGELSPRELRAWIEALL